MADFKEAFKKTVGLEGGYVNDPVDPGGETKYGISKRQYPDLNIKNLTLEDAEPIYKRDYWDKLSLDELRHQAVANELFDTGVNAGVKVAAEFLQEAMNLLVEDDYLIVDGILGPVTLSVVNKYCFTKGLLKTLNGLQFMHYYEIRTSKPKMLKFFRGWLRRIEF